MATQLQTNESSLAPGLHLRTARWSDLDAVVDLIRDVCIADGDPEVAVSQADLKREWKNENFTLETDAWVVETAEGRVVGYEELLNRYAHASLLGDGYVHPEFTGRGIGTAMLQAMDARALEEVALAEPDLRVFIRNGMSAGDATGRSIHEAASYRPIRFSWTMQIELKEAPPAAAWPGRVELRPFDREQHDRLLFEAHEEAFSDHWGHTPGTYSNWKIRMSGREDFDPSFWYIAWDGDQLAGYSLCRFRNGMGWVGTLGVRRDWRKKGLGMALLQHSFGEFHKRGMHTVCLGVDASNPTGATRLYQKAGMHIQNEYVIYEKEYRAGRDPAEAS